MAKTVFLDTNIYLHYQDIGQIDWLKVVQADAVIIVVPPITIRELNKHKDSHPRTRVRKRAGAVLKRLSALFISSLQAQLKSGVAIHLEDRDALIDFGAHHLSREIQDDNLIASIIMCRNEKPDAEIILATMDAGLTLVAKAKRQGITAIRLPDNLKLPEEPDPEQERIRELEQELRELKLKAPQLSLTFENGSQHAKFVLPHPIELTPAQAEERVKELQKRYPKRKEQSEQASESRKAGLTLAEIAAGANAAFLHVISAEDIAEYNAELDKFYQTYAVYLQSEVSFQNLRHRTVELEIWLSNDGTAPAEDIDIFMHFPDGFGIMSEDDFPEHPKPPKPPSPPKTAMEKLMEPMMGLASVPYFGPMTPTPIFPPSNVSSPKITRTSSYDVDVHVQRIKHKLHEPLDALYVAFESFDAALSFHIDYQILAANLPYETSGRLHVSIQKEG